ncbi:Mss4-like protein [Mycena vulgaris]|nr:Mss4-like protein [Mycena vulgaris]
MGTESGQYRCSSRSASRACSLRFILSFPAGLESEADLPLVNPGQSPPHIARQIIAYDLQSSREKMAQSTPKTATGGCLCEGVRYQIDFAPDHDWKPHTCQCTQCRKMSGSLVVNWHVAKMTEQTWLSKSTYAEYKSSTHCLRVFCKNYGSSIAWIELAVGCFDEQFLVGDKDAEGRPSGGYGLALAKPQGGHFYVKNEMEGVTDADSSAKGARFWEGI